MVATPSTMLPLGTKAPSFSLPDVCTNQSTDLEAVDIKKGCLIAFVCNHCPYVIHLLDPLVRMSNEWIRKGIKVFLISSNDADKYPDDSPVKMRELAEKKQFQFPYLYLGSLAQLVEQFAFNELVTGSNPVRPTIFPTN